MRLGYSVVAATLLLAGCVASARVYPLNDLASAGPMPKVSFTKQGMGRGPLTITMPDGAVLAGEYQVAENAAVGFAFSGAAAAQAMRFGSGRHVVGSAFGANGARMNCEGVIDVFGHGSLVCESNTGAQYRMMV